jgi:hypothetical protein
MKKQKTKNFLGRPKSAVKRLVALVLLVLLVLPFIVSGTTAQDLPNRSLQVLNPVPSATTTYNFNFDIGTAGQLGSIKFEFCQNSPVIGDTCDVPNGFSASSATLISQSGETGFSILPSLPVNQLIISRLPAGASQHSVSYSFNNMKNTTITGSTYVRLTTYATTDASGATTDEGGIAYAIINALNVSAEVPPYLDFCVGISIPSFNCGSAAGQYIDLGELKPTSTASGISQFMAATNANSGYVVTLTGQTLTSGNDVIDAMSSNSSVLGKNQFGINLVGNSSPNVGIDPAGPGVASPASSYNLANKFTFSDGDQIAISPTSDNYRRFTASYVANVAAGQQPGFYSATVTYICLATF